MKRKLIAFDWAIKRLLRSKANFGILEGFLSELLKEDIFILEVLESESNQDYQRDKFSRVDLKVRNSNGETIIIEIQYDREFDYLQRIFYAASKAALESMQAGSEYADITKVISVNILYFDLGIGKDYLYKGSPRFIGVHGHDLLQLNDKQKKLFQKNTVEALYPEYYLIKINSFNDIAKDTLDEWIYFLKNEEIKPDFTAKGLKEAEEKLSLMKLPPEEQAAYERYQDDLHYQASMFQSTFVDGYLEATQDIALNLLKKGTSIGVVSEVTGWSATELNALALKPADQ
ncbi:MAG: Rpn family recombination-promoting nuclease/putative transposase [Methylovulum sp.]|uniref:Rpn family recombination-promoting nuclease/putative transposase n=1 Tax=Methylovulum sp. TaxID=1916980 RepID=UPI00262635D8|nr:Rpn family recombination-promoting nuclease/putative transposase [Methylovulum sp.]MDD2723470.1 Rpn family recombination-promoting nuclease/putative transposase [Methylovulum sp.]MDD5123912.1 Rpn family recombination-promoting nuclease/putative transposase [Methylovulum sp.]